jgi:tetratricopeptide (TPR) repeat protein
MPNEPIGSGAGETIWRPKQVYAMAIICLLVGLAIGYLFRGSQSPALPAHAAIDAVGAEPAAGMQAAVNAPASASAGSPSTGMGGKMPSLDDMKKMADTRAEPLLAQLKTDPKNTAVLVQVANIYESTHQFKDAAGYYERALQVTPKNVALRTEMASCLYYSGDVDGAIGQLQQSLKYQPKDANALFNLGMIKLQGKQDGEGALAAWRQLLKSNPELDANHKATVDKLIADLQKKGKS